jgi:hypothetical protein
MNLASLGHCADAEADAGHLMNLCLIRSKQGFMHDLSQPGPESDFYFVQADGPEIAVARKIDLVKTENPGRLGLVSVASVPPTAGTAKLVSELS